MVKWKKMNKKMAGNKGYDCALSAIEMVNLMKQL